MLQREKLGDLFQLLEKMTLSSKENIAPKFSQWMQKIGKILMIAYATAMVLLVIVVAGYWFSSSQPVHGVPRPVMALYLAGIGFGVLYMLTVVADLVSMVRQARRKRFGAILAPLEQDLSKDAGFLAEPQHFDKPMLEYALIQYRHNSGAAGGRIALLVGDLRKVGLFPALTAASMAAATLLKDNANPLFWAPLIVTCSFYIVSVVTIGQRERVDQVIALMEYAVGHSDESPTAPPMENSGVVATANATEVPGAQMQRIDSFSKPSDADIV